MSEEWPGTREDSGSVYIGAHGGRGAPLESDACTDAIGKMGGGFDRGVVR
jgi:hypothetical protein